MSERSGNPFPEIPRVPLDSEVQARIVSSLTNLDDLNYFIDHKWTSITQDYQKDRFIDLCEILHERLNREPVLCHGNYDICLGFKDTFYPDAVSIYCERTGTPKYIANSCLPAIKDYLLLVKEDILYL